MAEEPREHHYRFAHRYLSIIAFKSPDRLQLELHRGGNRMLADAWNTIGKDLGRKDRMKPDGLMVDWAMLPPREIAVIALPTPIAPAEAYFVGIVFGGSLMPEVFTLEYAVNEETNEIFTAFGEWKVDGSHASLGPGPPPNASEFVRRILEQLGI